MRLEMAGVRDGPAGDELQLARGLQLGTMDAARGSAAAPVPHRRQRRDQRPADRPAEPATPRDDDDDAVTVSESAGGADSRLHLLSDSDLRALLLWGGLEAGGGRTERLQRLAAVLVEHRDGVAADDPPPPPRSLGAASPDPNGWLVDQLSSWRFPLDVARSTPGVPIGVGRASSGGTPARSGAGPLQPECPLPSDAKTVSRRHAEICWGLARTPGAAESGSGAFYLRSLQGGKKAVIHNGTKLQVDPAQQSIAPEEFSGGGSWVALEDGDRIIVGPYLLQFRLLDSDSASALDAGAPSAAAVGAAIRALSPAERKLLLGRDPSLQQYAVDETMRSWLDSSAVAAAPGPDLSINIEDAGVLDDDEDWSVYARARAVVLLATHA
jgi:hypothetical protein